MFNGTTSFPMNKKGQSKANDHFPRQCIDFKSAAPEYTLRTRIWASLRAQTLSHGIWHDELLHGYQVAVSRGESGNCPAVWWEHRE